MASGILTRLDLGIGIGPSGPAIPQGYSQTTYNGQPVTYNGQPVYDNGVNLFAVTG